MISATRGAPFAAAAVLLSTTIAWTPTLVLASITGGAALTSSPQAGLSLWVLYVVTGSGGALVTIVTAVSIVLAAAGLHARLSAGAAAALVALVGVALTAAVWLVFSLAIDASFVALTATLGTVAATAISVVVPLARRRARASAGTRVGDSRPESPTA